MLWAESASATAAVPIGAQNQAYVPGKFGEYIYTQIRRFVVVYSDRMKHFVKAWLAISVSLNWKTIGLILLSSLNTYGRRGTLKPGVDAKEHAIIYLEGTQPSYLPGESGMSKAPIQVHPATASEALDPATRIRFGRAYPIEWNVKVKDVGMVVPQDIDRLLNYWREEERIPDDEVLSKTLSQTTLGAQAVSQADRAYPATAAGAEITIHNELSGDLRSGTKVSPWFSKKLTIVGYQVIHHPRSWFKKGRVFMVPWAETGGETSLSTNELSVLYKIRRFVVIRPRNTYCICLPINTFQGQGTTKSTLNVQDHAAVVQVGARMIPHPQEQQLQKQPISVIIEEPGVTIDPMSRVNFAKTYSIEYNVKVRNIGRLNAESVKLMEQYFVEGLRLDTTNDEA
jgi:hypothetical protein